jgi:transposase
LAFHEAQPPLMPARPLIRAQKRGGRPARRTGHNLALRLHTYKDDVLRFLSDPAVPFTNNFSEQAARMMKLRQKISDSFRSDQGANDVAVIQSIFATTKKQGWNIILTLNQTPEVLIARLKFA